MAGFAELGMMDILGDNPVARLDVQALAAEAAAFVEQEPLGEWIEARLSRLLLSFLATEVVPHAMRAADQGIDPVPLFVAVTGVLRRYADALERPDAADRGDNQ